MKSIIILFVLSFKSIFCYLSYNNFLNALKESLDSIRRPNFEVFERRASNKQMEHNCEEND